jgi:predicted RNA binding protein YcfA (HicA-like mRNA interferase family)
MTANGPRLFTLATSLRLTECVWCVLMRSKDAIKRLAAEGWILSHAKGSHFQFTHPLKPGRVTVPHPKKDLPTGTLRNSYRQLGSMRCVIRLLFIKTNRRTTV